MASPDAKGALIAAILAAVALAVCCGGPLVLQMFGK
jgi:hypothetical protein